MYDKEVQAVVPSPIFILDVSDSMPSSPERRTGSFEVQLAAVSRLN
jgi:hypothetical protein